MKYLVPILIGLTLLIIIMSSGCNKDTSNSLPLTFSVDTLTFDTVFTSPPKPDIPNGRSVTLWFNVYNRNRGDVNISSIILAGGDASNFRMNVDGFAGDELADVIIPGNDSLFVFVDVILDAVNSSNPLIIFDSIMFFTENARQSVLLQVWGQDAYYHYRDSSFGFWAADKPHVVVDFTFVQNSILTIEAGAQVHFGGRITQLVGIGGVGAGLLVADGGELIVNGTVDEPVVFQGIRLESFFDNLPGQWLGIFILRESKPSIINYAIIKNAVEGISAGSSLDLDSAGCNFGDLFTPATAANLTIKNTIIQYCLRNGISSTLSTINAENCLVFNCGASLLSVTLGGNYDFKHCTFSNFGAPGINHQTPNIFLGDFGGTICSGAFQATLNATFDNMINAGSLDSEIAKDTLEGAPAQIDYTFTNSLVKTDLDTTASYFVDCLFNRDPLFTDRVEADYTLSIGSPCIDAGKSLGISPDLAGNMRDATPDIGAYEFIP